MKRKFCLTPTHSHTGLDVPTVPKVTERFRDIRLDRDTCAHINSDNCAHLNSDSSMDTDAPADSQLYRNPGDRHSSSSTDSRDGHSPVYPDDVFDEIEFQCASYGSSLSRSISREDSDTLTRMRGASLHRSPSHRKLPTVFKWEGGGKQVYLSGSFDGWKSKIPMVKSHGDFYTIVELTEGDHQFKYYVDNQWMCDQHQTMVDNDMGSKNNQVSVNRTDFEVFEALAQDSSSTESTPSSPHGQYSQHIPPRNSGTGFHHSGPPVLPPHLLQVILNKEIPVNNEPTLLPEPNHVMLNHLYALSIKDGVMVLSATHRYRKKYVTTLLYKPIQ